MAGQFGTIEVVMLNILLLILCQNDVDCKGGETWVFLCTIVIFSVFFSNKWTVDDDLPRENGLD